MQQAILSIAYSVSMFWLAILVGLALAVWLALRRRRADHAAASKRDVLFAIVCCAVGTFIGAKAFQLIGNMIQFGSYSWFWTLENWANMMPGVGVMYGGLIGGLFAGIIYIRRRQLDFKSISDILVPSVLLAHAFGRIGCFFAGCCHGIAARWGLSLHNGESLIPVQLFEAGFLFLIMAAFLIFKPERKHKGILLPLYFMVYAIGRFGLEFLRGDMGRGFAFGVSISQWISLLIFPVGLLMLLHVMGKIRMPEHTKINYRKPKSALAMVMAVVMLFGSSGAFAATAQPYNESPHNTYTLRLEVCPITNSVIQEEGRVDMRGYNIVYNGFLLEEIVLLSYLTISSNMGIVLDDLENNVPQDGAIALSFTPWWRNLNHIPGSGLNMPRMGWNVPDDFSGVQWSSSDESIFRVEPFSPSPEYESEWAWVFAEQPGTAYFQLTFNESPVTIQTQVTVSPRQGVFSRPDGFLFDPHIVRIETGEIAKTTLSLLPERDGIWPLVVANYAEMGELAPLSWVSSNPEVVRVLVDTDAYGAELAQLQIVGLSPGRAIISTLVAAMSDELGSASALTYYHLEVVVSDPHDTNLPEIPITGVEIQPDAVTIFPGDTGTLMANIAPPNASIQTLEWSSSNPDAVRVIDQFGGVITGIMPGTAVITARTTDGTNIETQALVTVVPRLVQSILLSQTSATTYVGNQFNLIARALPSNATNQVFDIIISDPSVISFDDGRVTALTPGTSSITFSATDGSGVTATAMVTVQPRMVQAITPSRISIILHGIGEQAPLTATVWPADATDRAFSTTVSDPGVIRFENGMVTALSLGTATIEFAASDGSGVTARTTVTVREPVLVQSIRLPRSSVEIQVGDTFMLPAAIISPSNATNRRVDISVDNPNIISIEDGVVIGLSPGIATVTFAATDGSGVYATGTVTVQARGFFAALVDALAANSGGGCGSNDPPTRVRINSVPSNPIRVGMSRTVSATVEPSGANQRVNWSFNHLSHLPGRQAVTTSSTMSNTQRDFTIQVANPGRTRVRARAVDNNDITAYFDAIGIIRQERSLWCWAAAIQMVTGTNRTQTQLVQRIFGSVVNSPAYLSDVTNAANTYALPNGGVNSNTRFQLSGRITETQLRNAVNAGRPVMAHIDWPNQDIGHLIVVFEHRQLANGTHQYLVLDPGTGMGITGMTPAFFWMNYFQLTNYQRGTWVSTIHR